MTDEQFALDVFRTSMHNEDKDAFVNWLITAVVGAALDETGRQDFQTNAAAFVLGNHAIVIGDKSKILPLIGAEVPNVRSAGLH